MDVPRQSGTPLLPRGTSLPRVRVPSKPPRPAVNDDAWEAALAKADRRTELMLRLGAEAGLRRAEIAQVHSSHLSHSDAGNLLLVHGKGGATRLVPDLRPPGLPDPSSAVQATCSANGLDGHLTPGHVGKLIARALPGDLDRALASAPPLRMPHAPTAAAGISWQCARCSATRPLVTTQRYAQADITFCACGCGVGVVTILFTHTVKKTGGRPPVFRRLPKNKDRVFLRSTVKRPGHIPRPARGPTAAAGWPA